METIPSAPLDVLGGKEVPRRYLCNFAGSSRQTCESARNEINRHGRLGWTRQASHFICATACVMCRMITPSFRHITRTPIPIVTTFNEQPRFPLRADHDRYRR